MAKALVADLGPGDALYLPPLWWHQVQSLEPLNTLVNDWRPSPRTETRPPALGALLHSRRAFAELPREKRHDWRTLFELYVFGDQDPAVHIPDARRGVPGQKDADALTHWRERIRSGLE